MNTEQRIKLAEAMGWIEQAYANDSGRPKTWRHPKTSHSVLVDDLPDPETDANDDYAVEEFMLSGDRASDYKDALFAVITERTGMRRAQPWQVFIGDRARAALKVLEGA